MSKYPEHEKMKKVAKDSQVIGEFIEWLQRQWEICSYDKDSDAWYPIQGWSIEKILAEYYAINLKKVEAEKRAMLAEFTGEQDGQEQAR